MKDFIKQNLVPFTIACVATVVVLVMLYFIIEVNSERIATSAQMGEFKEKIEQLNVYKPSPSKTNIEMIKEDINTVKVKIFQLENVFGNIYAKPLSAFIQQFKQRDVQALKDKLTVLERENASANQKTIDEINKQITTLTAESDETFEISFLNAWREYIENKKKGKEEISLSELLNDFIKAQKYEMRTFQNAQNAFMVEMQKQTLEPLNIETINDYILNALGIPLYFSKVKAKNMITTIQDEISKLLTANNVAVAGTQLALFSEITTVPTDEQISYITNYCRFLEDFYKRLAKSKIESIEFYNKVNGINGTEDSNYLIFRYQINVVASQESLRDFLNSLQEAYKDNRTYIVKALTFSVVNDNSNNLPPYVPPKSPSQLQQVKILLGTSDMIRASIIVDYVIFKKKILS